MLFLKRLSGRFDEEVAIAVAAGVPQAAAVADPDEHQFAVPESAHWSQIVKATMNLGEALNIASHEIEYANAGRIDGVLTGTNWNDESKLGSLANRERIIRNLLTHFNDLDLRDENFAADGDGTGNVLGDAYEYLIYQFADDAGKKGGEFYTPRSVVRLIVELLQRKEGMCICDPTFGSGGMLILAADYVQERGGHRQNLVLEGQERNLDTMAIGKVLFVDAAQDGCYRPGKAQNFLDLEHVDSIVSAFQAYGDVERFAHVADLEEIAGNDYNLNISRYVDTTDRWR